MCKFWSCVVDRRLKVWSDGNTSSHESIISKAGLKDNKLVDRDFVRLEITPSKLTINRKDWILKVDEDGTLPEWYERNQKAIEKKVYDELFKYLEECNFCSVCDFLEEIKTIKYLKPDGKPLKSWKLFEEKTWAAARDAARDAAWDAAWDAAGAAARAAAEAAARDAAWDAARDAARDAAEAAARDAAWDAARDAAGAAAWDAAWDAARDAAWDAARDARTMSQVILVQDKIDKKHLKHAQDRMNVWKKGYALRCDVGGVLYVYAKKK